MWVLLNSFLLLKTVQITRVCPYNLNFSWNCKDIITFRRIISKACFFFLGKFYLIAVLFLSSHPGASIYGYMLYLYFIILWKMGYSGLRLELCFSLHQHIWVISQCIFFNILAKFQGKMLIILIDTLQTTL